MFLRSYTADITLIAPDSAHDVAAEDQARLRALGISTVDGPCQAVAALDGRDRGRDAARPPYVRQRLSGARLGRAQRARRPDRRRRSPSETGCILVDAHQRTNVPGAYAAGDVVLGLDQISHAMGEGGVAATTIRNDLAKARPLMR